MNNPVNNVHLSNHLQTLINYIVLTQTRIKDDYLVCFMCIKIARKLRLPSADMSCGRPPDLWTLSWKLITHRLLPPWKTFTLILVFNAFSFQGRSPYGTDRRTDGRARPVLRPTGTVAYVQPVSKVKPRCSALNCRHFSVIDFGQNYCRLRLITLSTLLLLLLLLLSLVSYYCYYYFLIFLFFFFLVLLLSTII